MKRSKTYLDRLTKLAEWLEAGAPHEHVKFNMEAWLELEDAEGNFTLNSQTACGSVCCISGAAVQFFAPKVAKKAVCGNIDMVKAGANVLGLTHDEAFVLFLGDDRNLASITPEMAGAVVRHLIQTGVVDWSVSKRVHA